MMHIRHLPRSTWIPSTVLAVTIATTSRADTFANYCWNSPDKLDTNSLAETRNTFTIPDGTPVRVGYFDAVARWNLDSAMPVSASFVQNDTVFTHGDWANEVGLVNRSTISGNTGFTVYAHANFCTEPGHGGNYSEADSMIANDQDFQEIPEETFVRMGSGTGAGRMTMLHEMGHQLGLGHPSSSWNVMNVNGRFPAAAGDGTNFQPMPADVLALKTLYGEKGNVNLFPTAQNIAAGFIDDNMPQGLLIFCNSSTVTIKFTTVNVGKDSKTFNQRLRLIDPVNPQPVPPVLLNWPGGTVSGRGFFTWIVDVQLTGLPAGKFEVWHEVDQDQQHTEWVEQDNFVRQHKEFAIFPPQWGC